MEMRDVYMKGMRGLANVKKKKLKKAMIARRSKDIDRRC